MANEIKSDKLYIKDIFKKWYRIPEYQRPYVWGKDQINDLLDDISFAQQNDANAEYFLGSIVFQTDTNDIGVDLLDGQQRLTTLFLITAVIRDLGQKNEQLNKVCQEIIYQEGNEYEDIPERIRIIFDIRKEVKDFVDKYIKTNGNLLDLNALSQELKKTKDLSIKNMINAIFEIKKYFTRENSIDIKDFFKYLNTKVLMIYVSSSSLEDAFKLFTVMNDRGIKLRNSDILKAMNLREVSNSQMKRYAEEWESIENYFEEDFDIFLSHLRTILVKEKARKNLLDEFEEHIYFTKGNKEDTPLLRKGKKTFEYIKKYQNHYDYIFNSDHSNNGKDYRFNNLISIMKSALPADLWTAPLLRFYDKFNDTKLLEFLEKLDNKFSHDWIIGLTPTSRIENINNIIKKIDEINDVTLLLSNEVFTLNTNDFLNTLNSQIYGKRFTKYILYKLDYLYGNTDQINVPKTISVEHILPQNPKEDSQWKKDFTDEEREEWTHKIGNLVLISRRKNSSQGRLDFKDKKSKYFTKNIELFKTSLTVMSTYDDWKPIELKNNHKEVLLKICNHYFNNECSSTIERLCPTENK